MRKYKLFFAMLMLSIGMAQAQSTAYTYVKQNGAYVDADGTAAFAVSSTPAVMKFDDDDNAIMTIGDVTVAKIRANERDIDQETGLAAGVLAADFDNQSGNSTTGTLSVTVNETDADATLGYLTLYSPFQLQLPESSDVTAFASTYDETGKVLKCNSKTRVDYSTILPVCTSLILMYSGTINFTMSAAAATRNESESIEGYAVTMPTSDLKLTGDKKIFTLGHANTDRSQFGFFEYVNNSTLAAGKAFLVAADLDEERPGESSEAKFIAFDFSEDETAINGAATNINANRNGKFLENGRVIIMKNGQKFNIIGQEVK